MHLKQNHFCHIFTETFVVNQLQDLFLHFDVHSWEIQLWAASDEKELVPLLHILSISNFNVLLLTWNDPNPEK